jgi:hypothetical protein
MDWGTATVYPTVDQVHYQQLGFFVQDDFRLTPRVTLNLGVRWERETGPEDNNHYSNKYMDMTQSLLPFSNYQGSGAGFNIWTPAVQAAVVAAGGAAVYPTLSNLVIPMWTGAMLRTSAQSPRVYGAPFNTILPRAGVAFRLNDKTALRAAYSRFGVTRVSNASDESYENLDGYSESTPLLGPLAGVPRSYLDNPYPTGGTYPNPVILPYGNSIDPYTDVGFSPGGYYNPNFKVPINDRFNFNIQHQLPAQFRLDVTEYLMFEHNAQDGSMWGGFYTYNLNQMNPAYSYEYKGLLSTAVPNPFYNAFPATIMPGTLRTQATVPLSQLLLPNPQYGGINMWEWPGFHDHYYGLAASVTRPMSHGWTFLGTYNYSLQSHSQWYDDYAYYNNNLTMMDRMLPRHNIRLSGTYQLPFGKGRTYLSNAPTWLDEIVGGWATSSIFYWVGGDLLNFSGSEYGGVICNPTQNIPSGYWFNPNCLVTEPAYTRASSPWYYPGMRGPRFWDLDTTAVKNFRLSERVTLEFRLEMYNMPNVYIPADPNVCGFTTSCGAVAGKSTAEASASNGANYGRELQGSMRIHF